MRVVHPGRSAGGSRAVVIDDAQFAEASQRTLASVAQRLPAHVRLLVASQHNPVFSTSRLRLAGVIAELRAGDLAFTQVEVEQLLELAGLGREPIDARRLCSLTEGWPAGLQMAVLAMRAGGDPHEVIEAFASTTREASDYLANEVLNRLPSLPSMWQVCRVPSLYSACALALSPGVTSSLGSRLREGGAQRPQPSLILRTGI